MLQVCKTIQSDPCILYIHSWTEIEEKKMKGGSGELVFAVNGERIEIQQSVAAVDPSTTLLHFLRSNTRFKSVKLSCGEGGCGACVVLLSKYDPISEKVETYTVNSCLTLLCSIHNCSITTSEGLGNQKNGFHSIHQRLAGFHASQCGYCTPGMCVSLFSALLKAQKSDRKLNVSEAEKSIAGNLCRCTGYRPIADACKSFAFDVDIEDLGYNVFWEKEDSKDLKMSRLPVYDQNCEFSTFPEFLKSEMKFNMVLDSGKYCWHTPRSIEELHYKLKGSDASDMGRVKLVVSNTGTGYYKELEGFDTYIDLRYIPELSQVKRDSNGIEIGAAVSISKVIIALKESNMIVFKKIATHFEKIATGFIRNSASIGGNLVMAQRWGFPSDIATVLLAVDSSVEIIRSSKKETIKLEEFLKLPPLDSKSVIVCVKIIIKEPASSSSCKIMFESYRASPRPLGNTLPYLNAAFFAEVSKSDDGGFMVNKIQLAFGAYGTKHAIRAKEVEEFLNGKILDIEVLSKTINLVRATMVPEDGISHPSYRVSLAGAFLFEFLWTLTSLRRDGYNDSQILTKYIVKEDDKKPLLLPAKQIIAPSGEYHPVGKPMGKSGAALQASGEAVYVDDIPSPKDCLHGAFIYSTKPLAKINHVGYESNSFPNGVVSLISYKDIPLEGKNIGATTMFGDDMLFADDLTRFAGERIALVVADSQRHANIAAMKAIISYDVENLEPPILTVEDAVQRCSFFEVPPSISPKPVGDFVKGMSEAHQKIISAEIRLPSQYFFYMETQTALAIPDEDDCMVVYSSVQAPESTHSVIASCLGVPENNVRVITRRVGGGFGGKAIKAMPIATACALAAHKLGRPVRMYVDRKTDMIMAGGRHPMKITYSVGFKLDGKITALHLDILINAGISEDISPNLPSNIVTAVKKYNWGALSFDIKLCKTNHTSKTAMRAPGEVQGSFIAEVVIEHVASSLLIDVDTIREKNFHTFDSLTLFYEDCPGNPGDYTLPSIWDKLALSSTFEHRKEMVKEFNNTHMWLKKGISRIPIVYGVLLRPTPGRVSILSDGSISVEVGGIELGQGLWTKVKQMSAFALSFTKCDGSDQLFDKVRVIQADTLSMVQGGYTAGSTTSESSCEAVRICCDVLVERLTPLKERLEEQMGSVNWETLIFQAGLQAVNLSASSYFVPDFASTKYLNYGAAVSEVEVNLLTGETAILQSDIIYDCGQSLNPAIDLGQIEGCFVQGIGFFMQEEYLNNPEGLVVADSTWTYKIPTIDTIPRQLNVEIVNNGHHHRHVLSSKASGEPPLLLAASVHCATREAIKDARKQAAAWGGPNSQDYNCPFQLSVPATMPVVKELCGLDVVERYLNSSLANGSTVYN